MCTLYRVIPSRISDLEDEHEHDEEEYEIVVIFPRVLVVVLVLVRGSLSEHPRQERPFLEDELEYEDDYDYA